MAFNTTNLIDVYLPTVADEFNSGTLKFYDDATLVATFTFAATSESSISGGKLTFASLSNATAAATGTVDRILLEDSGSNTLLDLKNLAYTITAANQSTANNNFTETAHELNTGTEVIVSGTMPTTTPQIVSGQTLFVIDEAANTFQLALSRAKAVVGTAIAIDTAAGDDTFTVTRIPRAIVASGASAEEKEEAYVVSGEASLSITSGDIYSVSVATYEVASENQVYPA